MRTGLQVRAGLKMKTGVVAAGLVFLGVWATGTAGAVGPSQPGERAIAAVGPSRDSHDRQVRIHNQTGWIMTGLYAQNRSDQRRGDPRSAERGRAKALPGADRLALTTLRTGDSAALNIDDGSGACLYDLQAEFANGQVLVRSDINVCRIADYYFTR